MKSFLCVLCVSAVSVFAADWQIGPFTRNSNPVITPRKDVYWEALHTFNPAAVVRHGKVYLLYRAEDNSGSMSIGGHTSRIGLAESSDGLHFTRRAEPVLYPDNDEQKPNEWPGGVEDPRIVEAEDGTYVLTYTQWNQKIWRAAVATSRDLLHWTKHGPLFSGTKYEKYKSAGIVTRLSGRLRAAKINGKYWMYWGEGEIRLATSNDLIHWDPIDTAVLAKRPGHFDSGFPEVGPPPVLTNQGIVLIYNGRSEASGEYAAGQALFAADHPARLLARLDQPFLRPEMPFERSGQYAAGTTFTEGLVYFQDKWFLYYGCADSLVGAAVSQEAVAAFR